MRVKLSELRRIIREEISLAEEEPGAGEEPVDEMSAGSGAVQGSMQPGGACEIDEVSPRTGKGLSKP